MSEYEQLKKFPLDLPVKLNEHELEIYGMQLAVKVKEVELLEEKKKAETSKWAGLIKAANLEVKRLADARAKGEELRPVMCADRLHGNVIETTRLDTGAVVGSRAAELADLQASIPGTDGAPAPGRGSMVPDIDIDDEVEIDPDVAVPAPREAPAVGALHDENGNAIGDGVASSVGAGVYVSRDPLCVCGLEITEDDDRVTTVDGVMHARCAADQAVPTAESQGDRDRRVRQAEIDAEKEAAGKASIGEQAEKKKRERSAKKNAEKDAAK